MKVNNFEYTLGNKKIGKDTLIFNMGSATTCPSKKLGLCAYPEKCYALKAERQYITTLLFRNRQALYWLKSFDYTIIKDVRDALKKHKNVKYVRFNESGDFYTQNDIRKLGILALSHPDIIFYGYTARSDLNFNARPKNLIIQGSGFMLDNNFKVVPKGRLQSFQADQAIYFSDNLVACKLDCRACSYCKTANNKTILIELH